MARFQSYLFVTLLLLCPAVYNAAAQPIYREKPTAVAGARYWVDSVYNRLSEEERIGQLFMVAAYSGGKNYNQEGIEKLIRSHQIGGLIFMQGGPGRQATLTNKYQEMAQVPLLIGMDAEWGLGMRLDSVLNFPRQMMLGASNDTALAYALGMAVAYQCKRLGVHVNFAPVVDVNNNPGNPVINFRSFGEDKKRVVRMAIAYMRGMQDYGVMACAKHFPGHGDTDVDSHKDLPVVNKSLAQLDTLELYPFRKMIAAGVQSMMVAHLSIPALEKEPHVPTTLSRNTVTGLLKEKMGFKGLIFTDALNMQGVAKYFAPGETDVRAFIAGNDVLLFSQDVPTAITKIKAAIKDGKVSKTALETSVKKILRAKYEAGLAHFKPIETRNITDDINQYTSPLNTKIAEGSVTLFTNGAGTARVRNSNVLYIDMNDGLKGDAEEMLKASTKKFTKVSMSKSASASSILSRMDGSYDAIIVGVHGMSMYPAGNYSLTAEQLKFISLASENKKTVVLLLGNAYALKYTYKAPTTIVSYEDNEWTQAAAVRTLKGELMPHGTLPVTPVLPVPQNMNMRNGVKQ